MDEEGTEAAAATGVIMVPTMAPRQPPIEFRVDHPFLFLVRDLGTYVVLLVERALEPGAA